ncbi:MAG: hypothetical protein HOW73_34440 [Polyangiaceae bacterium]|nr:hypothetical protein [Polyangiaceae bacterium]
MNRTLPFSALWGTLLAAAPMMLASSACDAPPDPRSSDDSPGAETTAQKQPAVNERIGGARAVEELHVAWPERSKIDAAVLSRAPSEARDAISKAVVPVLLPRAGVLVEQARVVAKPAFVAASMDGSAEESGLHLSISATKIVHRHAGIDRVAPARSVRAGRPAWVLQNEGIWSVSWEENGVSYVVDLECARPSEDARCATEDRVLAIVEDLAFVGGSFETRGGAK